MRIFIDDLSGFGVRTAARELKKFTAEFSRSRIAADRKDADAVIVFDALEGADRRYSIRRTEENGRIILTLAGTDPAAVLYAMYRLLERGGMYFDICGHGLKAGHDCLDFEEAFACEDADITFGFRYRGIRQHINFPMDISSYRLGEAKEYIRSIARAGYDHITFHSYLGMWHGEKSADGGGGFFYNQLYRLPDDISLRDKIDNREIFCVPELEPYSDDHASRGKAAHAWLNALIGTAKEYSMHVTLSVEPLMKRSAEENAEMVRALTDGYPLIDGIEILSPEQGGDCPTFDAAELDSRLRDYFGPAAVIPDSKPQSISAALAGAMLSLKLAKEIYDILRGTALKGREYTVGVYITEPQALMIVKPIMYRLFDESVSLSFLPAHGSWYVAENLSSLSFTADELRRTTIYAWLEFDGSMYLMQNGCEGMERVLRLARDVMDGGQAGCVAFNHWRTAENVIPGSYGAEASAQFRPAAEYYLVCAERYGIGKGFASLMSHIAGADLLLRQKLFNIGFCYLGCYLSWGRDNPVSWIGGWSTGDLDAALKMYEEAAEEAESLAETAASGLGISMIRFIANRCAASAEHLRYITAMRGIAPYFGKADAADRIRELIDEAQDRASNYLAVLSDMMPDRGCQGTLVSYCCTVLPYIDYTRRFLLCGDKSSARYHATFDCPTPEGF